MEGFDKNFAADSRKLCYIQVRDKQVVLYDLIPFIIISFKQYSVTTTIILRVKISLVWLIFYFSHLDPNLHRFLHLCPFMISLPHIHVHVRVLGLVMRHSSQWYHWQLNQVSNTFTIISKTQQVFSLILGVLLLIASPSNFY